MVSFNSIVMPDSYRRFLYIASEPNHQNWTPYPFQPPKRYPLKDPFHGVRFPPGETLELLRDEGQIFTVTSWQGEPFTFEKEYWLPGWGVPSKTVDYEVMTVPWDVQGHRPLCLSDPRNLPHRYSLWIANHLIFLWTVFLAVVLLAAVHHRTILWLLPILIILAVMVPDSAAAGNMLSDPQCGPRASLPAYRTGEDRIRPVPNYRIVAPYGDVRGYKQIASPQALALTFLWLAHALIALLIVPAIKGVHYLLVPHPAERFVRSTGSSTARGMQVDHEGLAESLGNGDPRRPPPEFVSENQARRVRKLTERFRAERDLAEEVVRHGRTTVTKRDETEP